MALLSRMGTRAWLAAAVGSAAFGGVVAQPPFPTGRDSARVPTPPPAVAPGIASEAARLADPLGALLAEARTEYAKVRDYRCTFTRQERMNGVLSAEQVAEMKVRVKPYSVQIRFARPEAVAGMEMCFVTGSRSGKLRYRPAFARGPGGFQSLSLDDPKVMAETRHPATDLGIAPVLDLLAQIAEREKSLGNPIEAYAADYHFAGRNATRYEIFTRRPHAHRYAFRHLVYVDKETKLPLRYEAYDAPKPGATTGELLEAYSFTDVKYNVGLGDSAFD